MTNKEGDLSSSQQPDNEIIPISVLETVRRSFPMEVQNIIGVLAAAMEPISPEFIAYIANNDDGNGAGNPVRVTEKQVQIVLTILSHAEAKTGVSFFEKVPLHPHTESNHEDKMVTINPATLSLMQWKYRFKPEIQQLVEEKYPDLNREFHTMFANRLWHDLGFDELTPSENVDDVAPKKYIPSDDTVDAFVTDAIHRLGPGPSDSSR